jgi:Asp-tRNA(Asn)/Glu-tRNA(Gln) amidotransferase B subunit
MYKKNQFFYVDFDEAKQMYFQKVLPQKRRDILKKQFSITDEDAFIFVANDLDYIIFEIFTISNLLDKNNIEDIKLCVRVLLREYLNQVNTNSNIHNIDFKLKCQKIVSYIELRKNKEISTRICLRFFAKLFESENIQKMAAEVAKENNFLIINDTEIISDTMRSLMETNTKAINDFKNKPNKRTKIFDFFMGRVHKAFNDCADPEMVNDIVLKSLKKLEE